VLLNWMLKEIEVEPLAIPKLLGNEPDLRDGEPIGCGEGDVEQVPL